MVGKSTRKKDINKQANKNKWTSENVGDSKSEMEKKTFRDKTGKSVSQAHAC